jgi:hypothetical protein
MYDDNDNDNGIVCIFQYSMLKIVSSAVLGCADLAPIYCVLHFLIDSYIFKYQVYQASLLHVAFRDVRIVSE